MRLYVTSDDGDPSKEVDDCHHHHHHHHRSPQDNQWEGDKNTRMRCDLKMKFMTQTPIVLCLFVQRFHPPENTGPPLLHPHPIVDIISILSHVHLYYRLTGCLSCFCWALACIVLPVICIKLTANSVSWCFLGVHNYSIKSVHANILTHTTYKCHLTRIYVSTMISVSVCCLVAIW